MGFAYSAFGLCCDFCDHDSRDRKYVKKIECPYGYCQAWACCDVCRAEKKHMQCSCNPAKITHKEYCLPKSIEYEVEQLNKKGIRCEKNNLKCSNCKAPMISIQSGTKFAMACIYEKCKIHSSFEDLEKTYAKVLEAAS